MIYSRNWLKLFKYMGEIHNKIYQTSFDITLENGNIDGGGGECSFSLIILKKCLLLQLTTNSSYTVDARITKHLYKLYPYTFSFRMLTAIYHPGTEIKITHK